MTLLCLSLVAAALLLSMPLTWIVRELSRRAQTFDTAPIPGQIKAPPRRVPNTGGIAIFWSFALPVAGILAAAWWMPDLVGRLVPAAAEHLPGVREKTPVAITLLVSLAILHTLGLIDDRKPLGPFLKLAIMTLPAVLIATFGETRLLTLLDAPGSIPIWSTLVTVIWFLVVTNAMNFMDNMDGLSAGCTATASVFFLFGCVMSGQWFVAACLALLLGAVLGFLVFNRPPASIFMGDGGSLVLGYLLAFLTARTTYISDGGPAGHSDHWFTVFTPLVILAIPLYDFTSVTIIRLRAGKSPFVGDLNHLSHRLVRRGMTKAAAVSTICGLTAVTGVSGLLLHRADTTEAMLIAVQVALLLIVVARVEFATAAPADEQTGANR